jgi:hypothetical protein
MDGCTTRLQLYGARTHWTHRTFHVLDVVDEALANAVQQTSNVKTAKARMTLWKSWNTVKHCQQSHQRAIRDIRDILQNKEINNNQPIKFVEGSFKKQKKNRRPTQAHTAELDSSTYLAYLPTS